MSALGTLSLEPAIAAAKRATGVRVTGRVTALRGLTVLVADLPLPMGSMVMLPRASDEETHGAATGEVIGFSGSTTIVMMLGQTLGIRAGDPVVGLQAEQIVRVGDGLLGRVINGLGRPIDGRGEVLNTRPRPMDPPPLEPLARRRITQPLATGIRAIDFMCTMGRGQRLGIFAGPGVGKSTLLGSLAKNSACDVAVLALIGERGREVKDFIEHVLGPQGLKRSVVVVSTGDESPLMRTRAAMTACAVAEHFRDHGKDVLLMVDSITRFAHAQRQIGLSVGEPPASKGYTPSVFSAMARLLERAGAVERRPLDAAVGGGGGSITGLYTILVEGDDMTEPVADAARGILDGHLILSRGLAQKGHYPAIDVMDSVSRVFTDVTDPAHQAARRQLGRLMALYAEVEDLVQIGAYAKGSSPDTDVAIAYHPRITDFLKQSPADVEAFEATRSRGVKLATETASPGAAGVRK